MPLLFSQLETISKGKILSFYFEFPVFQLLTDSRAANFSEGTVFFAISGKSHDGHQYLNELYKNGIRQFVVEDKSKVDLKFLFEANVFLVENSIKCLQDIATFHRKRFLFPVIGITGSNGKTIVKEWLYQLLSPDFSIVKSPKSYNSQIGVPLSVWQMEAEYNLAIFEAGISTSGEMSNLEHIIKPTIGIFTNVGPAHSEGFDSFEAKIKEKAILFSHSKKIIYCKNHSIIDSFLLSNFPKEKLIAWDCQLSVGNCLLTIQESKYELQLPFKDSASIENLIHCVVLMLQFGISISTIQSRIRNLVNIPMRLELKAGKNNNYLIDDTYNNDPEGLKIALQFMQQQDMKCNKVLVLSEMHQIGLESSVLYKQISALVFEKNIGIFIGIGKEITKHSRLFPANALFYEDVESLLEELPDLAIKDSLVLIKGARVFQFERIVQFLAQKIHRTVLEINLNALANNLKVFRQMVKPETKIMVMVKAFAYGSGTHEIAHLLQYHKVDYLAVAYTDEGVQLRENNIILPIMVMNPSVDEFETLAKNNLEPEIYSFSILQSFIDYCQTSVLNHQIHTTKVHLAIDTGMHRLGFEEGQIAELCEILKVHKIKVASVFSHLVGADGAEFDDFSEKQALLFDKIAKKIENELGYKFLKHLLNSAGITRHTQYQYDMVRLGIGLYGIEAEGHPSNFHLQNVSTLKTIISQIRNVEKGESVGYSRKSFVQKNSKIATLAIGYADGYSRVFGNGNGKVWIKGKLAPIIGNVCMDMCMADITGIEAEEGDEVIVFGENLPVEKVALIANTISYEILTSVSERVKRVYFLD
jgi:Alr-MurF fusion protein